MADGQTWFGSEQDGPAPGWPERGAAACPRSSGDRPKPPQQWFCLSPAGCTRPHLLSSSTTLISDCSKPSVTSTASSTEASPLARHRGPSPSIFPFPCLPQVQGAHCPDIWSPLCSYCPADPPTSNLSLSSSTAGPASPCEWDS